MMPVMKEGHIFLSLEAFRSSKSRDGRVHQMESQNLTRNEVEEKKDVLFTICSGQTE